MLKWNSSKCDEVTHANRIERGSDGECYRVITTECHKILYLWNSTGPDGAGFFTHQKVVMEAMHGVSRCQKMLHDVAIILCGCEWVEG